MKVLVQHTLKTPADWVELGSFEWIDIPKLREPRAGRPQGDEGITDKEGWVYDLNVQGTHFGGADHYAVEELTDGSGGVRVTVWNDDPEDYPPGEKYARVWTILPLAPDPAFGGAINARQSHVVYAEPLAAARIGGIVLPWSDFVPPPEAITRHGIWISDALSDQHLATRRLEGWRDWGQHLDPSELDENGRVKIQADLGRKALAAGTITYYQRDTDRAVGWAAADHEDAFEKTTATAATETATVAKLETVRQVWAFTTPSNEPNSADWPNGTYRAQFDVTAIGGDLVLDKTEFHRVDSTAANSLESKVDEVNQSGVGLKLFSVSWDPLAGNASDRFGVRLHVSNFNAHMSQDITLEINTTDSYADGPWTVGEPAGPPVGSLALVGVGR